MSESDAAASRILATDGAGMLPVRFFSLEMLAELCRSVNKIDFSSTISRNLYDEDAFKGKLNVDHTLVFNLYFN